MLHFTCCLAPGTVRNVRVRTIDSQSVELTWFPPTFRNGVIGYLVTTRDMTTMSRFVEFSIIPSDIITSPHNQRLGVLLKGLFGSRTYNVSVRAYNMKYGDRGPAITRVVLLVPGRK